MRADAVVFIISGIDIECDMCFTNKMKKEKENEVKNERKWRILGFLMVIFILLIFNLI